MYKERQRQGGVLSILLIVPCPIVPFVPKCPHKAGAGPSLYQGCLPS